MHHPGALRHPSQEGNLPIDFQYLLAEQTKNNAPAAMTRQGVAENQAINFGERSIKR